MTIDLAIVIFYFAVIMFTALKGGQEDGSAEEFFVCSRSLKWPSIALSTIATNVHGYQFLGMMGSAYLFGLAQANLEINAVVGLFMAAFIFVPLYLDRQAFTITQFIEDKLGPKVALVYSCANILIFSTLGLGSALFWGAYAADLVFSEFLSFLSDDAMTRTAVLVVGLGIFSAIYTYYGGLAAVVRTDMIQFGILLAGGILVLLVSVHHVGGWGMLYEKTPELMHLHLPADHEKLPWIAILGMFLLNINYWGANQAVLQRSLAAKNLREAQIGLMVGGVLKYLMAVVIVVPGIALAGIMIENPLPDPDQTFPYLVTNYLPTGVRGLILCALFASLMSTVDSMFNSIATLFSVDIYKRYLKPDASDAQMVRAGRNTILVTLATGMTMAFILLYLKLTDPGAAFTHMLNELRYYINNGIAVLISIAVFLVAPSIRLALVAVLATIPLNLGLKYGVPDMNYFVRSSVVILSAFAVVALPSLGGLRDQPLLRPANEQIWRFGLALLGSLAVCHLVFH